MVVIGLVLALVICGIVYAATHATRRSTSSAAPGATGGGRAVAPPTPAAAPDWSAALARWVAAGVLDADQARAIERYEADLSASTVGPELPSGVAGDLAVEGGPGARAPRRVPVVAEALGYLGGLLATIGIVLVVARYWPDASLAARLVLSGAGVLVLLAAGQVVHADADPAYARLQGFLWLASSACAGLFAGVVAADGFDAVESTPVLAASSAVLVVNGLLWRGRDHPLQQTAMLVAGVVTLALLVLEFSKNGAAIGMVLWVTGAAYLALGLRRLIREPVLTEAIGAVVVVIGASFIASEWMDGGIVFALLTALAILTLAAVPGLAPDRGDEVVLVVIGLLALGQALPQAVGYFAIERDAGFVTGMVLWAAGAGLVFLGVHELVRAPTVVVAAGGAALLGGAALTGTQYDGFAPVFGIVTAVGLIALGMLPGQVLLSVFGSLGLLINVPWVIGRFFPGEARAPVLLVVAGLVILGVAILLTRMRGGFRQELGPRRSADATGPPPVAA